MTKNYLFETEHFRFAHEELQLLRSRYAYRIITFKEISKISLTKGIRVKRPIFVLIFGLTLTIASLYVLLFTSGFLNVLLSNNIQGDSVRAFKAFGYFLIMGGFLLAIGGVAIFQATFPTWIMKIELTNGKMDVVELDKLFETNEVFKLSQFLRTNFSTSQLTIDRRIG